MPIDCGGYADAADDNAKSQRAFVSACCDGERCYCGEPAKHKIEETIFFDDPNPGRHPFTSYVCHDHFVQIMGPCD